MEQAERMHRALRVLEALAREMCERPRAFEMDADVGNTAVKVTLRVGGVYDSKRLVGRKGATIAALSGLARMMFRGTGRVADIGKVQASGRDEGAVPGPFVPAADWPRERLVRLLKEAAEAALCGRVEVRAVDRPAEPNASDLLVEVREVDADALEFGRHAAAVFKVVGVTAGRRLFLDVTAKRAVPA